MKNKINIYLKLKTRKQIKNNSEKLHNHTVTPCTSDTARNNNLMGNILLAKNLISQTDSLNFKYCPKQIEKIKWEYEGEKTDQTYILKKVFDYGYLNFKFPK